MTDRRRWILVAAVLGSGIVFLDSTVVNVALPRIGRDLPRVWFGVLEGQSYVYNAYLLTLSALLILAGALTDFYGRKRMFVWGLIGFGATSVLCGLAPNMELLVLFRIFQGAAGALLVPGSLALITANFEGEAQGRAFGVWAGASGATTILGPVVGGFLVDSISWRAAFLINVPLILVALWATYQHVPESRDEEATGAFDWIGSVIVALAVGGLAFGVIYGQQRDWRDPLGFIALGVGIVFTAVGLNLYRDGRDSVAPHNDHLNEIREGFPIALVSLGATRRMVVREKKGPRRAVQVDLEAGSLFVMDYATQLHYTHGVPKTTEPVGERISLAFRVKHSRREADGGAGIYK